MDIDVEALLEPVDADDPTGVDMDYDPARFEIKQVFETAESSDPSGAAAAADEVDWNGTIRKIVAQFEQTKDVWLPTYLCRAGAKSGQLDVIVAGAEALAGLFERYWDTVHPRLDELGLPGRKTPCDALTLRAEFLGPLERTPLITHPRLGNFSGADFERFRIGGEAEDGYLFFRNALAQVGDEGLATARARISAIKAALKRADDIFTGQAQAMGEPSPNFRATFDLLDQLGRSVDAFRSSESAADEPGADEADNSGSAAPSSESVARGRGGGAIESREDVIRMIDAICDYYRRREPSSPVPMVLQRAREWVKLDFLAVLQDIAPDSISDARRVLVSRNDS